VVVETVSAFVIANPIVVDLALLLVEGHVGWDQEETPDNDGDHTQPQRVFDSHVYRVLDALLEVNAGVQIGTEDSHLEEDPRHVYDRSDKEDLVEGVLWLVQFVVVVPVEKSEGDLVEQDFLSERDLEIVRLDFTERD